MKEPVSPVAATPEDPPGFVVRTEAQKAAFDNGYRLEKGIEAGWFRYGSTTAHGDIWIAGASAHGPWMLSLDHSGIMAELKEIEDKTATGPGFAVFVFTNLSDLYAVLERVYRLGCSLPDAPFRQFVTKTRGMPTTTEAERLIVQRVGQGLFRDALLDYWNGRCPLTGISDPALLRASHIVPWAECENGEQRLDVYNGLLLSALWDAAFDAGLVSFADDGAVMASPKLCAEAAKALGLDALDAPKSLDGLTKAHRENLTWHRQRYGLTGKSNK